MPTPRCSGGWPGPGPGSDPGSGPGTDALRPGLFASAAGPTGADPGGAGRGLLGPSPPVGTAGSRRLPGCPQPVDKCVPRVPFPPVSRDFSAGFGEVMGESGRARTEIRTGPPASGRTARVPGRRPSGIHRGGRAGELRRLIWGSVIADDGGISPATEVAPRIPREGVEHGHDGLL